RTPDIRTLFVLGLNEREFPRLWTPDPILGNEERARLETSRPLGPDSRRRTRQEHYLAYIALTRASERVGLSRPLLDEEGKATDPSPWLRLARQAFPQVEPLEVGRAGRGDHDWLPRRAEEWALALTDAVDGLDRPGGAARLASMMAAGDPVRSD